MKKLEKLTLKELLGPSKLLNEKEANDLKGGTNYMWTPETGWSVLLDEVTVLGSFTGNGGVWYGNFLGPGPSGNPDPSALGLTPVNQLDSAAYNHDLWYYVHNAGGVSDALFNLDVALADAQLSREAFAAAMNGDNDLRQIVMAGLTSVAFGAIAALKLEWCMP